MWEDDFDAILAILEEDESVDHQFESSIKEVYISMLGVCMNKNTSIYDDANVKHWAQLFALSVD